MSGEAQKYFAYSEHLLALSWPPVPRLAIPARYSVVFSMTQLPYCLLEWLILMVNVSILNIAFIETERWIVEGHPACKITLLSCWKHFTSKNTGIEMAGHAKLRWYRASAQSEASAMCLRHFPLYLTLYILMNLQSTPKWTLRTILNIKVAHFAHSTYAR